MDKKTKHITINLSQSDYDMINKLAVLLRRSVSELASLILIDNASKLFIEYHYKDNLKPALFIPSNDIDDVRL